MSEPGAEAEGLPRTHREEVSALDPRPATPFPVAPPLRRREGATRCQTAQGGATARGPEDRVGCLPSNTSSQRLNRDSVS